VLEKNEEVATAGRERKAVGSAVADCLGGGGWVSEGE
jgi:hypothetical protein